MDTERMKAAHAALAHTSYEEMAERFDTLEAEARRDDIDDPQEWAEVQFRLQFGFHLDEAFTVYVALCLQEGRNPVLPDGTPISVTSKGAARMGNLVEQLLSA